MAYELVYRTPEELLRGEEGDRFLRKTDLENLVEYNLLYFLRGSSFHVLHDYPCMGGYEKRLRSSHIEGPYESAPKVKNKETSSGSLESSEDIIELLIPKDSMPIDFEKVSLVEYGTQIDGNSERHLASVARKKMNTQRMIEIGKEALENLRKIGVNVKEIENSVYQASSPDFILNLNAPSEFYIYPAVSITVFGRNGNAQELVEELGLYELSWQFSSWDRDVGIRNSVREGVAYDLSLDEIDLPNMSKHKNVIL